MANIKSAMKRTRVIQTKTMRNKRIKTNIKNNIKKVNAAVENHDADAALEAYKVAVKSLDKGVAKGIVHQNSASRKKSTLARKINTM